MGMLQGLWKPHDEYHITSWAMNFIGISHTLCWTGSNSSRGKCPCYLCIDYLNFDVYSRPVEPTWCSRLSNHGYKFCPFYFILDMKRPMESKMTPESHYITLWISSHFKATLSPHFTESVTDFNNGEDGVALMRSSLAPLLLVISSVRRTFPK